MNSVEYMPLDALDGFDINAAFQGALYDIASDAELELTEKVRRMETVIQQGISAVYRDFIDFRAMATQIELACSHDHMLPETALGGTMIDGFLNIYASNDGHEHHDHDLDDDSDDEETVKKPDRKAKRQATFADWLLKHMAKPKSRPKKIVRKTRGGQRSV